MLKAMGKPGPRRHTAIWIVLMAAFILELFAYTWCRVQWTTVSYAMVQADRTHRALQQMEHRLQTELASLHTPARLETEAVRRLGLVQPQPRQMTRLP